MKSFLLTSTVVNKFYKHYEIPHNNLLEILSILEDALNIHNTLLNGNHPEIKCNFVKRFLFEKL